MDQGQDGSQIFLGESFTKTVTVASKVIPALCGEITFKRLNVKERIRAGLEQARLREGIAPDLLDYTTNYTIMILAELFFAVTLAPPWWYREVIRNNQKEQIPAPDQIADHDLILDIWEEYAAFRESFPGPGPTPENGGGAKQPGAVASSQNPGSQPV